jgi:outer membrane protein assembly factor BamB
MFSLKGKFQDILDWHILDRKIYHKVKNDDYRLYERNFDTFDILWKSDLKTICDFAIHKKWLVLDSDDNDKTVILNSKTKEVYHAVKNRFAFGDNLLNDKFLVGNSRRKSVVIDILSKEVKEYPKEDYSFILVKDNDVVCRNKLKTILSYRSIYSDLLEIWQFDITQFGTYKENKIFADQEPEEKQREIYRVYYQQDKIIASISRAVIALNPQNGELLWKIDFEGHEPIDLIFDKDVCYGGQWRFTIIDIRNGVKILESDYDRDIEIEGNIIPRVSSGSGLVLHNEFLWCTFSENKNRFLTKLNPENGKIIDAMKLDTTASTRPPIFDENRVCILDQDGELFIYEEQN